MSHLRDSMTDLDPILSGDKGIPSSLSDHCHDSTYSEMITTEQRKAFGENLSEGAKKRVEKATEDLANLRCIISNAPVIYSVEYAHILPRATDPRTLAKLEYSWGMRFGTVNVDSRYNIMCLNSVFHKLFDDGQWILLPEEPVIDSFLSRQERPDKGFMEFVQEFKTYRYKFIPARDLGAFEIRRHSTPMEPRQQAGPVNFDPSYYYPFDKFPTITSHVQPHFVIYNIGHKMKTHWRNFFGPHSKIDESQRSMIDKAVDIFEKWTKVIPPESNFYRNPYKPADDDDNDSTLTKEGRRDNRAYRRSLHTRLPKTPSQGSTHSRKRARGLEEADGLWLDDETLRVLDDKTPRDGLKRKRQSVSAWISSISEVKFDTIGVF